MSKQKVPQSAPPAPGVVNWNTPKKRDLVERALSDGITDPAKIIAWAKNRNVAMTVEEVKSLAAEIKGPKTKS